MPRLFRLKRPTNPILLRIARPDRGPSPTEFLNTAIGISLAMMLILGLFSLLGILNTALTILQIAAFPATLILAMAIVLTATVITLRETSGEPYQLLRLTDISTARLVWGLCLGIVYRLRQFILGFMWAFGLALLPIALRVREITADETNRLTTFNAPVFVLLPLFLFVLFTAALGIAMMLVANALTTSLRLRSLGLAAAVSLFGTAPLIVGGILIWLIVVSLAGGWVSMLLGLLLFPLPYSLGWVFVRRWQTDPLRLVIVTAYAPIAVIIFVLFTAILGFGRGAAAQSDQVFFWALNGIVALSLLLAIQMEWGLPACPELIVLLVWQVMLVGMLARGESVQSERAFETVVWLMSNTLLLTPYAIALSTIDRARQWVWPAID